MKAFEKIIICDTDPGTFRAFYGLPSAVRVFGPWKGNLSNSGERINLKDKMELIDALLGMPIKELAGSS